MKRLLVTGGAGFIGSNFIRHILPRPDIEQVVNLDLLTYAGNLRNLSDVSEDPRYTFVRGDIRDRALTEELFARYAPDTVVHFAAESHVDRSITEPEVFLTTNAVGTLTLLEAAKSAWSRSPGDKHCREYQPGVRFLQVSTDEVYGALDPVGLFREDTPLAPNSPYAASKASGDLLVRAFAQTYGLPVNITRCSNNYGPYQFPEKLIPLIIHNARTGRPLPVYGDGLQVRDWLHVNDHCRAIETVLERGRPGEIYNVGGSNERTNLEIIRLILQELEAPEDLIVHIQDRPGHDRRYAIDSGKLQRELGWKPRYTFEEGLRETVRWYLEHEAWTPEIVSGEYQQYYAAMYGLEQETT